MTEPEPPLEDPPTLADYLTFWHPTRDEALSENHFSWGDVEPGSSADREFRVRNMSASYKAGGITISLTEIRDYTRATSLQHLLSRDGHLFTATVAVGMLLPYAVSQRLTLRRVVAPDADSDLGEFQLVATATEWT